MMLFGNGSVVGFNKICNVISKDSHESQNRLVLIIFLFLGIII